jgi:hypothetical protein
VSNEQQSPIIQAASTFNIVCRNIICFQFTIAWTKVINFVGVKLNNFVKLKARRIYIS